MGCFVAETSAFVAEFFSARVLRAGAQPFAHFVAHALDAALDERLRGALDDHARSSSSFEISHPVSFTVSITHVPFGPIKRPICPHTSTAHRLGPSHTNSGFPERAADARSAATTTLEGNADVAFPRRGGRSRESARRGRRRARALALADVASGDLHAHLRRGRARYALEHARPGRVPAHRRQRRVAAKPRTAVVYVSGEKVEHFVRLRGGARARVRRRTSRPGRPGWRCTWGTRLSRSVNACTRSSGNPTDSTERRTSKCVASPRGSRKARARSRARPKEEARAARAPPLFRAAARGATGAGDHRVWDGRPRRPSGREPGGPSRSNAEGVAGGRGAPRAPPPRSNANASRSRELDLAETRVGAPAVRARSRGGRARTARPPSRGGSRPAPPASASYRRACRSRSRSGARGAAEAGSRTRARARAPPPPHHDMCDSERANPKKSVGHPGRGRAPARLPRRGAQGRREPCRRLATPASDPAVGTAPGLPLGSGAGGKCRRARRFEQRRRCQVDFLSFSRTRRRNGGRMPIGRRARDAHCEF